MSEPSQSIFISYARDDVAFARDLRERLVAFGHDPWMDLFDIPAGARWPDEIDRALRSSDAIIGVMSPASMGSENVKNEWDWAIANQRRLILLLIEPCEIPFHYVSRNYIDLTSDQAGGYAALASAIESQDAPTAAPAVTSPVPDPPPPVEPEPGLPIVGRQRELSQLREALDKSLQGQGQLVLIGGEAGIGKTTLVEAVANEAGERGFLVLRGGCYDLTTTPPYGPWVEITRDYPTDKTLPGRPPQLQEGTGMEGVASRGMLFDLVGTFVTNVAAQRPLALILEDLHWSDAESLALLRHLARMIDGHSILMIATYRDDELTRRHQLFQLLPVLARESRASRVDLRSLPLEGLRELVTTRYALDSEATERLTTYLQERADGNPLFAEEMLRTLEAERILEEENGSWSLDDLSDAPVPPLIIQLIESRLIDLDPETQRLLEVAAVIGQDVPIDLWASISGADERSLSNAVSQAVSAHLIQEHPATFTLEFRHALIREALYSRLVLLDRRRWHRAVADQLLKSPQPDPDELVTHLGLANDPRLTEWLVIAGDRAMSRFAWDVAIERYQHAVDLLEIQGGGDARQYCELLLSLGDAQERAGAGADQGPGAGNDPVARATFWEAAGIARKHDFPNFLGRAALGVAGRNFGNDHGGLEGVQLMEDALKSLPQDDSPLRVRLLTRAAMGSWFRLSGEEVSVAPLIREIQKWTDDAMGMARRLADPESIAYANAGATYLCNISGQPDKALEITQETLDIAAHDDFPQELLAFALLWRHYPQIIKGDIDAARQTMDAFATVVERLRTRVFDWHLAVWRTGYALSTGEFDLAMKHLEDLEAIWPISAAGTVLRFILSRELDAVTPLGPVGPFAVAPWSVSHLYALEQDDLATARDLSDEIWRRANRVLPHLEHLGVLYLRMLANISKTTIQFDDQERAKQLYDLLVPYADYNIHSPYSNHFGDAVDHHLGTLAAFLREWQTAEEHFERAIELEAGWGTPPAVAWSQYHYSDMLHRRGNPGDRYHALELLDQALELAREIGMVWLERMATELQELLKAQR